MEKTFDFIVVGSGLAGLSFALNAAKKGKVLIITKSFESSGSTNLAQGGIASVMAPKDSLENHIQDTLLAGAGLCRNDRVKILVNKGPGAIQKLVDWGVRFSKTENKGEGSPYHLAREGGHSNSRILHSEDLTGREIQRALVEEVKRNPNILVKDKHMGLDLITHRHALTEMKPACYGIYALDLQSKKVEMYLAHYTIMCTGGAGQVYAYTTNDKVSTGDGIAMAVRAGAKVEDMEFIQFHPTSLYDPGHPIFLISEALRGHGGILRNQNGDAIMANKHPMADLAPRDVVARCIDAEMKLSGKPCVYLDMTAFSQENLEKHFPNIYSHCKLRGFSMEKDWIPVVPAAHFICGGIKVNENSESSLKGLFACGETASTGVHGANRLASNSLLEAAVFSDLAFEYISGLEPGKIEEGQFREWDSSKVVPIEDLSVYTSALENLKNIMWNYVGIVRSDKRLKRALDFIRLINTQVFSDYASYTVDPYLIEIRNLALIAELIIVCALQRKESRGLHFNMDYPDSSTQIFHSEMDISQLPK